MLCAMGYNISLPIASDQHTKCPSPSTHDMSSSPTLNVDNSTLGRLSTCLQSWEQSASLDESIMRMEAFISMLSLTSHEHSEVAGLISSMWTVATRTSQSLVALQRRVTTTQSKMATWWQADSVDPRGRAEVEMGRLWLSGLQSRRLRIESSFGNFATSWIQRLRLRVSLSSASTAIGDLHQTLPTMNTPLESISPLATLMDEICGWHNLELAMQDHS